MVWIHGGSFLTESGNMEYAGPHFLVEEDIIFVSINYRLGPLGFFCLANEEVPGNAGLKDQVLALKWVQENIKQFGGDPSKVTIAGESAGSFSVEFHKLSPWSKGRYYKIIQ
ncbi:Cholinesterase 1 [Blattella germanica]|nr:Cholinesterase 1 [Blattella germanica]